MRRTWQRSQRIPSALIVAGLVLAVSAIVLSSAGGPSGGSEATAAEPANPKAAARAPQVAPLFEGWENPHTVLVLTGQRGGYLEPCGCTENQSGGLARLADLFHQIWGKSWPTVGIDDGGSLNKDRLFTEQALLKLDFFRKATQHMRYAGVGLGVEELRLGGEKLFEIYSTWSAEDDFDFKFLSANVTILSSKDLGVPIEYSIVKSGGLNIGITSVIGTSKMRELPKVDPSILKVDDPMVALPAVLAKMKAEPTPPDFYVLLAHADDAESEQLAKAFPIFKVVVTAGGPEDPESREHRTGETLLVHTGRKGKYAACVGVFGPKGRLSTKLEMIELTQQRFETAKEMTDLMRAYQDLIRTQRPDSAFERPFDRDATFVGVDECKDCHKKAYDVWINSAHAHALESLTTGRADEKPEDVVDRQFDPECLACHVTGWDPQRAERFKSGFVDLKTTPKLKGQQCENCHGPGSRHVALELEFAKSKKATPDLEKAREELRDTRSCDECHDHDNSPKFEYDAYWNGTGGTAPVVHEGVD